MLGGLARPCEQLCDAWLQREYMLGLAVNRRRRIDGFIDCSAIAAHRIA